MSASSAIPKGKKLMSHHPPSLSTNIALKHRTTSTSHQCSHRNGIALVQILSKLPQLTQSSSRMGSRATLASKIHHRTTRWSISKILLILKYNSSLQARVGRRCRISEQLCKRSSNITLATIKDIKFARHNHNLNPVSTKQIRLTHSQTALSFLPPWLYLNQPLELHAIMRTNRTTWAPQVCKPNHNKVLINLQRPKRMPQ